MDRVQRRILFASSSREHVVKNNVLIVPALGFALSLLAMPLSADAAGKQRSPRGELVHEIVMKWGDYVQEAYRADVREWASEMAPLFAEASLDSLRRAADARTFDAMNQAFTANGGRGAAAQVKAAPGQIAARSLGEPATDLVFVPVTPCRLFDTRLAGGQIAANTVRDFDVTTAASYAFQGGAANNCGGVGAAGSFAAAALNLTVVSPNGAGYITAFPHLGTQPLAATVNYAAGAIVGNYAVVKLDQGSAANELSVYSFAATHLVGDIVGYYINPTPTALECRTLQTSYPIVAGGAFSGSSPTCEAGYTRTGGGCYSSSFSARMVSNYPNVSRHSCTWVNDGANAMSGIAMIDCCRVPGR